MRANRINNEQHILVPISGSLMPTQISIRKHPGTGRYQWWGNDGKTYSPASNNLSVVVGYRNSLHGG
jgi:hypothetical protein